MGAQNATATVPGPSTEEHPCACYGGLVFAGHLVEEDGEDVEIYTAYSCRRCSGDYAR